jgi:hypothetical protein
LWRTPRGCAKLSRVKITAGPKTQGISVVLIIVALDFVGIGRKLPIIPRLIRENRAGCKAYWRA